MKTSVTFVAYVDDDLAEVVSDDIPAAQLL